jgi:hypothetical protein
MATTEAMAESKSLDPGGKVIRRRLAIVLVIGGFFAVAVFGHLFHVNSHYYHRWIWQRAPLAPTLLLIFGAAVPFFLGQMVFAWWPARVWMALMLVTVSMFLLMLAGAAAQRDPPSLRRIVDVVVQWDTGYFQSAQLLLHRTVKQWLSEYPQLQPMMPIHPRTKPPGLVLFERCLIDWLGQTRTAAMVGGLFTGFVAMFSVPATYGFIYYFAEDRKAAFWGASYFALCPGPVLIFPGFDQWYPIFTLVVMVLWALALRKDRLGYSALLGVVYAGIAFLTYLPGVLAFFLIGYAWLLRERNPGKWVQTPLKHALTAMACFVLFYLALWEATGFNAIATFRSCLHQVDVVWAELESVGVPGRHLPWTIPADLYDFALGSGWMSFVLAIFYFKTAAQRGSDRSGSDQWQVRIALLCIGQILFVAFTGLIQGETARLWTFMLPMLLLPVGLELGRWPAKYRICVFAMLLVLTALICRSMSFFVTARVFPMDQN